VQRRGRKGCSDGVSFLFFVQGGEAGVWFPRLVRCRRDSCAQGPRDPFAAGEKKPLVEIGKGDDFRGGDEHRPMKADGFSRCEPWSNLSLHCSMKCSNWLSCAPPCAVQLERRIFGLIRNRCIFLSLGISPFIYFTFLR
jgi:hypothetical protein